jgi:hypothetical protein
MSTSQEAPALIQYACERCKTQFVLPPSSRKLKLTGKFKALGMGLGRTFKLHEGLGTGIDTARRQLLAKMDDEAYQSFVQSFRFCHECRQFVCNDCWSTSRRSCLTCVAKSMTGTVRPRAPFVPTGPQIPRPVITPVVPRRGRMRRDLALVALALAIVLVSLEAGILLVNATGGTANASPTPTAEGTPIPSDSSTASSTDNNVAVGPSPSATDTPFPTDSPTPEPTFTPSLPPGVTPSPRPLPTITCNGSSSSVSVTSAQSVSCSWTNAWFGTSTKTWYRDSVSNGSSAYWSSLPAGNHTIHLNAVQNGSSLNSNYINVNVSVAPVPTPTPVGATPTPSPAPTSPPPPAITCNGSTSLSITTADSVSCSWGNTWGGSPSQTWYLDSSPDASSWSSLPAGDHTVYLHAGLDGSYQDSNTVSIHVS